MKTPERLETPTKSPTDQKSYRAIRLANGLTALLIQDAAKEGDKKISAAALTVDVGSFHDPRNCPGLAHFCEHMLFMGSKKYPEENYFSSFISRNGGRTNAFTSPNCTTYNFSVAAAKLQEALDIWAQFFIDPIMGENAVEREMKAVNSEFDISKSHDGTRLSHVLKEAIVKKNHQMANFPCGNIKSLKENLEESGTSAFQLLHQWYPQNYSTSWMYLTIQSTHSLNDMENWVDQIFNSIPNRNLARPANEPDFSVGGFDSVSRVCRYQPVGEMSWMIMTFPLPPQDAFYKTDPLTFIAYLMIDKGPGSILANLKKLDWAHDIHVGPRDNKFHTMVSVSIRMTEAGFENWSKIGDIMFAYIRMAKKLGESEKLEIFEEVKKISDTHWNTKEESDAYKSCTSLSNTMPSYPSVDWLTRDDVITQFDITLIENVIDALNPRNCYVQLINNKFEKDPNVILDKCEKWTEAKYGLEDLDSEIMNSWENSTVDNLKLPEQNPFLSENFELNNSEPSNEWKFPQKILENKKGELWFKGDGVFNLPRGIVGISLRSGAVRQTPTTSAMNDFLGQVLQRLLVKEINQGYLASVYCQVFSICDGITLKINGINDKIHLMLSKVLEKLTNFDLTEAEFKSFKTIFTDDWKSRLLTVQNYGLDLRLSILRKIKSPLIEKRAALLEVTRETFVEFVQNFMKNCWIQGQVQGNFYQNEAIEMFENVLETLDISESFEFDSHIEVLQLPDSPHLIKRRNLNLTDSNSFENWYWQIGSIPISEEIKYELLMELVKEPCFDFLRTKRQLGYAVYCQVHNTDGMCGASITVRSQRDKFTVEEVKSNISEFLEDFKTQIEQLSDKEFEESRLGIIEKKMVQDTKLQQSFGRNSSELVSRKYKFDRNEQEVKFLNLVTKSEIIEVFHSGIFNNSRFLISAVEGNLGDRKSVV